MKTKIEILQAAQAIEGKRRQRTLTESDADAFLQLTAENPGSRVRVYSAQGFAPNSYRFRAPITYVERGVDGVTIVRETDAKRSNRNGSTRVVAKPTLAAAPQVDEGHAPWTPFIFTQTVRVRKAPARLPSTQFVQTDAGRGESGLQETKDCTVRAYAACLAIPYHQAHAALERVGRHRQNGIVFAQVAVELGLVSCAGFGGGTLKTLLAKIPTGRFIVKIKRHVFAIVDGVVHDTSSPKLLCHVNSVYCYGGPVV